MIIIPAKNSPEKTTRLTLEHAAIILVVGHDNLFDDSDFNDYEVVTICSGKESDDDAYIGHVELGGKDYWIYER